MALIKCSDCGSEIRAKADCPRCGAPYERPKGKALLFVPLGLAFVVLVLIIIRVSNRPESPPAQAAAATTSTEPSAALLDFTKPISLRPNARLCQKKDELTAALAGAPANCMRTPVPIKVAIIDCSGLFPRTCQMRPKFGNPTDLWASVEDLQNDADAR
jgi:hypothetical protein